MSDNDDTVDAMVLALRTERLYHQAHTVKAEMRRLLDAIDDLGDRTIILAGALPVAVRIFTKELDGFLERLREE